MDLSIVTTLYKSELYIETFIEEILASVAELEITGFEVIIVNDGSPDKSLDVCITLKKKADQIKVIDLSRNFGHHNAILAGLTKAEGDLIFLIDCDLETSPKSLIRFYNEIKSAQADVVFGYRNTSRKKSISDMLGGLFWRVFNSFSTVKVQENLMTERIMTKKYVHDLLTLGDKNLFLGGMFHWTGYNQIGIPIEKKRRKEKSTYSFSKRLSLLVNAISSFSASPLILIFRIGLIISSIALSYGGYLLIKKILFPTELLSGFTTLAILIVFSFGIQLVVVGLIGIYISKIFNQVQNRPLYIIKKIYE